jgi:hypothetical protein
MRLQIPARAIQASTFSDWTLYRRPDREDGNTFLWLRFRLMLPPDTPKRNGQARAFDLAWNPAECRFARTRDTLALLTQQPELAAAVELYLSLNYGPEWLSSEDGGGYTPAEIQAETARLAAERAQRKGARGRRAQGGAP